jgi:hypothetical protein
VIILRASSPRLRVPLPRQSRAITGTATGRAQNGSSTRIARIARITQVLPYPIFSFERADPSWVHSAAQTFLPRRRSRVSSTATCTRAPAGISAWITAPASRRPNSWGSQAAREKNRWTR